MEELQVDIVYIDGIIFGLLYTPYENYSEVIIALSFFGLSIKWR